MESGSLTRNTGNIFSRRVGQRSIVKPVIEMFLLISRPGDILPRSKNEINAEHLSVATPTTEIDAGAGCSPRSLFPEHSFRARVAEASAPRFRGNSHPRWRDPGDHAEEWLFEEEQCGMKVEPGLILCFSSAGSWTWDIGPPCRAPEKVFCSFLSAEPINPVRAGRV